MLYLVLVKGGIGMRLNGFKFLSSVSLVMVFLLGGSGCNLFQSQQEVKVDDLSGGKDASLNSVGSENYKGDVIAVVGKRKLYKSEFESWLESNDLDITGLDEEQKKALVKTFVESIVLAELARQRGLDKDPKIKSKMEFAMDSVLGVELLSMEAKPLTESEIRDLYEEYYTAMKSGQDPTQTKFMTYLFGNTYIGPSYTKQSILDMLSVTTVSPIERIVYEIAVDTEAEAKKVMADFWANGANASTFRMLARQYSVLRNASSGGKKKYSELDIRKKLIEAQQKNDKKSFEDWMTFYNAVFTTPEQKPSDIINVFGKYYIVYPVQQRGGQIKTWDELDSDNKQLLINLLNTGKAMITRQQLLDEFRQSNEYTINFDRI